MWTAFSAGVLATFVQFSIPPILPLLTNQYQVTYTNSALLMSLFALATVLSAVPGGFIVQKYGVRKIGLLGLGFLIMGIVASLLATNFLMILLGRMIGGIGFGLVSVASPSAIGQYVPQRMMSVAMGIWSTWIPVGSFIMFLSAPKIVLSMGTNVYWISILIVLALGFLFYGKVIPKHVEVSANAEKSSLEAVKPKKDVILDELKNKNIWWAGLAFASFTFAFFSFNTWITTYLTETTTMSLGVVTLIPSLVSLLTMTSNVYSGFLLKKLGNHLIVFLVPPLFFIIVWPLFTSSSLILLFGNAIILGLFGGFIPTIAFASAPLLAKRKESIGISMSIIIIGENVGVLIGPEVFGFLREWTGAFTVGFWSLSIASLVMLISSIQIWRSGVFGEKYGLNLNQKENSLQE
jgi:predicted MFS family arabinose efflux permease